MLVELREISKRFGAVVANDGISLTIRSGEVHALLGENGAGKTTLMSVLAGMIQPDAGTILLRGAETVIASPRDAIAKGIGTVYQHFTLVPTLSVIENVMLGGEGGFRLDVASAEAGVRARLGEFGVRISPRTLVRHLAVGQRQRVEVVKVLSRAPRVLLLDEPTSLLTLAEVAELFPIFRRLTDEGVGVVLITHKLEEALDIADRITVLRAGRTVGEVGSEAIGGDRDAARRRIVELMFGGSAATEVSSRVEGRNANDSPVLSLVEVSARDERGVVALTDLSVEVQGGEIFGVAGVDGNGQKELGEVVAGLRAPFAGRVVVDGKDVGGKGVTAASRAGVGYVTDDRLGEGCVSGGSVALNAVLKRIDFRPFSRHGLLDRRAIAAHARDLIDRFEIRTPSTDAPVDSLSGGNIQKLLLARELAAEPRVLVCNKPTNGLDARTARSVLDALRERAAAGAVVVLISSELEELLAVCDQIGVMYRGRLVGVLDRSNADPATIGRLMLGGELGAESVSQGAA